MIFHINTSSQSVIPVTTNCPVTVVSPRYEPHMKNYLERVMAVWPGVQSAAVTISDGTDIFRARVEPGAFR